MHSNAFSMDNKVQLSFEIHVQVSARTNLAKIKRNPLAPFKLVTRNL